MVDFADIDVLIVDDEIEIRALLRKLLADMDCRHIEEAADGGQALARLSQRRFSIVISDWRMAPMSGLDLLQAMRSNNRLATIPFLMVTAESGAENLAMARNAGVDDYIVKPISAGILRRRSQRLLSGSD